METRGCAGDRWIGSIFTAAAGPPGVGKKESAHGSESTGGPAMSTAAGTSAFYAARDGVVLGLDPGAQGGAWGYGVAAGQVVWASPALPWPHYFMDLSGVGGSADPASGGVLLADCAQAGPGQRCTRPELTALNW